jgi:hypothetical protein
MPSWRRWAPRAFSYYKLYLYNYATYFGRPAVCCGIMRLNDCSPCQRTVTRTCRRKNQWVVREAAIASTETGEPFTA